MEPTELGGRQDLLDRVGGRKLPDDFTALDEWTRQTREREAAQHPRRERLAYWAVIAILVVVGLGALTFMVLYFFLWAP